MLIVKSGPARSLFSFVALAATQWLSPFFEKQRDAFALSTRFHYQKTPSLLSCNGVFLAATLSVQANGTIDEEDYC